VAVLVFLVTEVHLGVGEHFGNPHLMMNYQEIVHWSYHHAWIVVIGVSSVKISVGCLLLRLVQGKWYKVGSSGHDLLLTSNASRRCIIGWIAFLFAFTLACCCTM
jgi:hypothetical protein